MTLIVKTKEVIVLKKNFKILFILVPIIAVICLLCMFSFNKTTNGIDSIRDYESVFQSVDELKFYIEDNNFYSTKSPNKELKTIKKWKSMSITMEPLGTKKKRKVFNLHTHTRLKILKFLKNCFSRTVST